MAIVSMWIVIRCFSGHGTMAKNRTPVLFTVQAAYWARSISCRRKRNTLAYGTANCTGLERRHKRRSLQSRTWSRDRLETSLQRAFACRRQTCGSMTAILPISKKSKTASCRCSWKIKKRQQSSRSQVSARRACRAMHVISFVQMKPAKAWSMMSLPKKSTV